MIYAALLYTNIPENLKDLLPMILFIRKLLLSQSGGTSKNSLFLQLPQIDKYYYDTTNERDFLEIFITLFDTTLTISLSRGSPVSKPCLH